MGAQLLLLALLSVTAEDLATDLRVFLDLGRTAAQAAAVARQRAQAAGFRKLDPLDRTACGAIRPGDRLLVALREQSVLLVRVGRQPGRGRWIGAHLDGCGLRVQPGKIPQNGQMRAVAYGGIKPYHYRDRPLLLTGRVVRRDGSVVDLTLGPSDGFSFLVTEMPPPDDHALRARAPFVVVAAQTAAPLQEVLRTRFGVREDDLAASELYLVPAQPTREVGLDRALVGGPGQDDRLCSLAALRALLDARDPDRTAAALLVDREEEGSHRAGARSELVDATEACLAQAAQVRPGALFARSQALSADVKAGVDPLFPQVHELRNAPVLGGGPTLVKFTGGGWFRGSEAHAELVAAVRALAARIGVPLQGSLSGRVDEGGGGTIALFLAQRGMDVVDVGLPVLSMHSPFEISAKSDLYQGYRLFMAFFEEPVTR